MYCKLVRNRAINMHHADFPLDRVEELAMGNDNTSQISWICRYYGILMNDYAMDCDNVALKHLAVDSFMVVTLRRD